MKFREEEMWQACVINDDSWDGLFYYGVKTTGIFCRPSCHSRVPKRENVLFFSTLEEALNSGFRPCKRCRPDLVKYSPVEELIGQGIKVIEEKFSEPDILNKLPGETGLSPFHFQRQFKKVTHPLLPERVHFFIR